MWNQGYKNVYLPFEYDSNFLKCFSIIFASNFVRFFIKKFLHNWEFYTLCVCENNIEGRSILYLLWFSVISCILWFSCLCFTLYKSKLQLMCHEKYGFRIFFRLHDIWTLCEFLVNVVTLKSLHKYRCLDIFNMLKKLGLNSGQWYLKGLV